MAAYVRFRLSQARLRREAFEQFAERVLSAAGEADSELSIELVGDGRMRRLNRLYRGKDRPTDVLAFPQREADNPQPSLLGDVVLSIPMAARQAREAGHSLDEELATLLIHGVLHLCGYDHERGEQEARRMFRRERALLRAVSPLPRFTKIARSAKIRTR